MESTRRGNSRGKRTEEDDPMARIAASLDQLQIDTAEIRTGMRDNASQLTQLNQSFQDIQKATEHTQDELTDLKVECVSLKTENAELKRRLTAVENITQKLLVRADINDNTVAVIDNNLRKRRIIIEGIAEEAAENLTGKVMHIITLLIPSFTQSEIGKVFRMGHPSTGRPRTTVLTFVKEVHRDIVLNSKTTLRNHGSTKKLWITGP